MWSISDLILNFEFIVSIKKFLAIVLDISEFRNLYDRIDNKNMIDINIKIIFSFIFKSKTFQASLRRKA